jgi:hypothetical protein
MHSETASSQESFKTKLLKMTCWKERDKSPFSFMAIPARAERSTTSLGQISHIPLFRLGSVLCGCRSTLKKRIKDEEDRGWKAPDLRAAVS